MQSVITARPLAIRRVFALSERIYISAGATRRGFGFQPKGWSLSRSENHEKSIAVAPLCGDFGGTLRYSAVIMFQRQWCRRTGGHLRKLPLSIHFANRTAKKSIIDDVAGGLIVVRHI